MTLISFSDSTFIVISRYHLLIYSGLEMSCFQFNAKFTPADFPLMRHFKERVYLGVETITKLDFQEGSEDIKVFVFIELRAEIASTSKSTFSRKLVGPLPTPIQLGKNT